MKCRVLRNSAAKTVGVQRSNGEMVGALEEVLNGVFLTYAALTDVACRIMGTMTVTLK